MSLESSSVCSRKYIQIGRRRKIDPIRMEARIIKKVNNPLLRRTEIYFEIDHPRGPTPRRMEARKLLADKLKVPEDLVLIEKLATPHGRHVAAGIARVYNSRERLEELEPKYLLEREARKEKTKKEGEEKSESPEENPPEEKSSEGKEGST